MRKTPDKEKKPAKAAAEAKRPAARKPLYLSISTRDKVVFTRNLAALLDAGIPLHEALGVLEEQFNQPSLRYVLGVTIADLADGAPLYASLAKFPRVFDPFFVNAVTVGESSGTLSSTLRYLGTQLEKSSDLHGKVSSALVYPAIVMAGAVGIGIYLAFYMLPKVLPLFVTLKVKLPPTTRALLAITGFTTKEWPYLIAGILGTIILVALLFRVRPVRYAFYRAMLSMPVMGDLTRNVQTAKFSRILGTLLTSGVTIVQALRITSSSTDDPVYLGEIGKIAAAVERGESIGEELRARPLLFSRTTSSMIGVGDRTGRLSESLINLAEFSEREVDVATRNLSTLIEPLSLILVGVMVGFVALSIITPIYQITQGIHM